jgi:hypothetical protein
MFAELSSLKNIAAMLLTYGSVQHQHQMPVPEMRPPPLPPEATVVAGSNPARSGHGYVHVLVPHHSPPIILFVATLSSIWDAVQAVPAPTPAHVDKTLNDIIKIVCKWSYESRAQKIRGWMSLRRRCQIMLIISNSRYVLQPVLFPFSIQFWNSLNSSLWFPSRI